MNIVYSPTYTILAAGILLIIPVVFHLIAFRKSIQFIHILSSILVGNFILAFMAEIAGLAHFFDAKIILILSLLVAGVIGYLVKKKNIFNTENIIGTNISKTSIFLVIGIAIFLFLYQKNFFPPFTPDTVDTYLVWARTIVNQGSIPAFDERCWRYVVHYPPFLYTTIAFLFSFFGGYFDSIAAAIPILYSCLFVFLITNWGEEHAHADRYASFFIIISLLLAPFYFTYYSIQVLQEAPILFFATASFYFLFKYLRTKETIFLVLLSISSALMSLTKYSGLVITAILFCMLIIGTRDKKEIQKIFAIFPLIHIPNVLWAIRNFYYFNNPVYPAFKSIFKNSIYPNITLKLPAYLEQSQIVAAYPVPPQEMAIGFFIVFPAFIFTLFYMFRNWRKIEVQYTAACFVIFLLFLYISSWRLLTRYLYPFLGVFALYAGIEMLRWYNAIPIKVIKRKKNTIVKTTIIILCIMTLLLMPIGIGNIISNVKTGNYKVIANDINPDYLDPREPHFKSVFENESEVLNYLQNNEKEKNLIIFGEYTYVFDWYGNYTTLQAWGGKSFLVRNQNINKEPFDFAENSTYMHNKLKKLGVDYIYDSAAWEQSLEEILFDKINQDTKHFELVYNKNGYRLWKLK